LGALNAGQAWKREDKAVNGPCRLIRFSGFTGPEKDEKNLTVLEQTLQGHGIKTKGKAFVMRYNPHGTLCAEMR